ncbi:MAG: hypothetical protein WCR66_00465 [Bacteroidota bacterium]
MIQDIDLHYSKKIAETEQELKKLKNKLVLGSSFRLFFFLLIVFSLYHLFQSFQIGWLLFFVIALIGFLGMISWYVNIKNKEKYQLQLNYFFQNELDQIKGNANSFDDGFKFDDGAGFWSDLDLFGKGSVYHCINRTVTEYGQVALANQFKNSLLNKSSILEQQEAIKIYASQMDVIESVIATSLVNKTDYVSFDPVFKWLNTENILQKSKWAKFIRFVLPLFNSILIIVALTKGNNSLLGIVFILGWIQISMYAKYLQSDFNLLGKKESILNQYAQILLQFKKINPANSTILQSYQITAQQASAAIRELSKISNRIDQRLNLFLITFVNPIFLYDIQNMFALEAWKLKHHDHLIHWIHLVGEIEKLNSFAIYNFNNQENVYPIPLDTKMEIQAMNLSHPLISKEKRIANNISIGALNKVLLITGSNMSGKTTFLRTIGVNLVLAQTGLSVPASHFSFSPMQIYSSIRISDSLQESTSYFMAELKKLSAIKTGVKNNPASLVLIDEILRGTNSEDKYFGSAQFVKEMLALNCITLFATHDLKLSELELQYPDIVVNYCFESIIENNELSFSYKIQRGVAKNRNASFLMKKMGII